MKKDLLWIFSSSQYCLRIFKVHKVFVFSILMHHFFAFSARILCKLSYPIASIIWAEYFIPHGRWCLMSLRFEYCPTYIQKVFCYSVSKNNAQMLNLLVIFSNFFFFALTGILDLNDKSVHFPRYWMQNILSSAPQLGLGIFLHLELYLFYSSFPSY